MAPKRIRRRLKFTEFECAREKFKFLVCHMQPNFKLGPRLEDEVMKVLKSHYYPFTISRSHLMTIGVQHTWPPLLAALSYLRTCIESVEQVDVESLLISKDENGEKNVQFQIYQKFVEDAYTAFLACGDEQYEPLFADLEKKIESCSVQCADLEVLEQETDHSRQMLAGLESQPNELLRLENENETLSLDIEKLEKFVAGLVNSNNSREANVHALAEELHQKVAEKEALANEVKRKTYIASNQRVSGVDAQRINSQLMDLKSQVAQAEKELEQLDKDLIAEDQSYNAEKTEVTARVAEYNRMAQMLQLIPASAANAAGFDYEMKPDLTQAESIRFETSVMPALHMLSQQLTEKCRQHEDEATKMKDSVEQMCEVIGENGDQCTSVTNTITAIDNKLEHAKECHAVNIQQLQARINELNSVITARISHGTLERGRQLLQTEYERLEADRKHLQDQENTYGRHLIAMADLIAKYKNNMKENLPKKIDEVLSLLDKD